MKDREELMRKESEWRMRLTGRSVLLSRDDRVPEDPGGGQSQWGISPLMKPPSHPSWDPGAPAYQQLSPQLLGSVPRQWPPGSCLRLFLESQLSHGGGESEWA